MSETYALIAIVSVVALGAAFAFREYERGYRDGWKKSAIAQQQAYGALRAAALKPHKQPEKH